MADYAEADQRLMDWLAERTDTQLQRLLDAAGLNNITWCGCLAGHAFGWEAADTPQEPWKDKREAAVQATAILELYGLRDDPVDLDGTILRRIQGFAAAELLTRRVERKALPPAREVCTADPLNSLYSEV